MASRCCGNPGSCVGELSYQDQANYAQLNQLMNQGPSSGGLTDYCQQMQALGGSGGNVNGSLAGVCNSKQLSCNSICSQLANKYLSLMSSCNNCGSQDIYQQAYSQLSSRVTGCQQFASRVTQIANQAATGAGAGGYAAACNQLGGASPQAGMGMPVPNVAATAAALNGGSDPYGCAANPTSVACQSCTANPNSPACQALNYKEASGTAQFAGDTPASKTGGAGFDIPDAPTGGTERVLNTAYEAKPGIKNGTVANNTGGGIPGGGGTQPASLGGGGRNAAGYSPGSPGYTTDILQGTQGAGGYSNPVEPNNGGSGGGGGYGSGRNVASNDDEGGMLGLDLRQFLPGGSRDPQRRLAGLGARSEINAKEEDIWRRISSKMEEKCKLGILIGCR
jgi:hypothetical protein